jgi:hypothetical protein
MAVKNVFSRIKTGRLARGCNRVLGKFLYEFCERVGAHRRSYLCYEAGKALEADYQDAEKGASF